MNSPDRSEVNAALEALEHRFERRIDERLSRIETDCRETRAIAMSLKSTIVTTSVASSIAIIIGFSALSSAMHNNILNAFSSGKEDAALQAQMKRDQVDMRRAMDEFAKERAALQEIWRRQDAEIEALRRKRGLDDQETQLTR